MLSAVKRLLGIPEFPDEVVGKWMKGYQHTPDFHELEQHQHRLVFIYDGPRSTESFGVTPMYNEAYTEKDEFVMIKHQIGEYTHPVVVTPPEDLAGGYFKRAERAPIRGQIFQLKAVEIASLDTHMENTVQFHRVPTKIVIPFFYKPEKEGEPPIPTQYVKKCFMYLGNFDYWNYIKASSSSYKLLKERENNTSYRTNYHFTPGDWK